MNEPFRITIAMGGEHVPADACGRPRCAPPRTITREMVYARTRELALAAVRKQSDVTQADYEQAKCKLTGEVDPDRQLAMLDRRPDAPRPAVTSLEFDSKCKTMTQSAW